MKKYNEISDCEIDKCKELSLKYEVSLAHVVDIYRRHEDFKRTCIALEKELVTSLAKNILMFVKEVSRNLVFIVAGIVVFMCFAELFWGLASQLIFW